MRKMFRFLFWTALIVGAIVGLLRLTAIRWWRVPLDDPYLTASISPSIRPGDLILLWRLTRPGYGDLVLCPEPKRPDRIVVGRLVGESRDDIEVTGGDILINGRRKDIEQSCTERTFTEHDPETRVAVEQHCNEEDVNGLHYRGEIPPSSVRPADVKATVPDGTVWLVSDNRLYPYDSRDFGPVPRETCKETVFFRLVGAGGFFDTTTRNQYIR